MKSCSLKMKMMKMYTFQWALGFMRALYCCD